MSIDMGYIPSKLTHQTRALVAGMHRQVDARRVIAPVAPLQLQHALP